MNQLLSLLFFLGLLERHDNIEKLVSKTHHRYSEIDDHGLTHDFRSVFRIWQFSSEIKFETLVVIYVVVSKFDVFLTSSFYYISLKQRIDSRI